MTAPRMKEIALEGKDKISQAHLDAVQVLLQPLIQSKKDFKPIPWEQCCQILRDWDNARRPQKLDKPPQIKVQSQLF